MQSFNYQHWHTRIDENQWLWLTFDKKNSSTNTINPEVLQELQNIVQETAMDENIKSVIFNSGKASGFIAGAEIDKFTQLTSTEEAKAFIQQGIDVFNLVSKLPQTTVAMVEGFCVGGGMELILACDYRVATNDDKTRLGLPEVLLGIRPGWGGSERLPALIGAKNALIAMTTGKLYKATEAYRLGMIDAAVPKRQLLAAVSFYASGKGKLHEATFLQKLSNTIVIRPLIARLVRSQIAKKVSYDHYPAPFDIVDHFQKYGIDFAKSMAAQPEALANAVLDPTAQNLVRVFFLREKLKDLAKASDFQAKHVHVIGAGTMGGDIAAWCAAQGLTVTLQDREASFIEPAMARAFKLFKDKFKKPRLINDAMDRLTADVSGFGVAKADVIIEAIFENVEAKQNLFRDLEIKAKPNAILATNTSSIPLDEINSVLKDPSRLVGIHFFNPVSRMLLVEVVKGQKTAENVVNDALSFVKQIDRLPLPVASSPGFLVNRVLMAYLMEAMILFQEGISPAAIDKAALAFGMPMGPIELADTVGLDICLSVAKNLTKAFGGEVPAELVSMVEAGKLGKKSGQGFYRYKNGKAIKPAIKSAGNRDEIMDRLVLRYVNECMACLREHVISNADLLDAGMIFGTGFAPFRGGPIHYAKQTGIELILERMKHCQEKFGERFVADVNWELPMK